MIANRELRWCVSVCGCAHAQVSECKKYGGGIGLGLAKPFGIKITAEVNAALCCVGGGGGDGDE